MCSVMRTRDSRRPNTDERAAHLRICVCDRELIIPTWEKQGTDGERRLRLRCGQTFPLLALYDDLRIRVYMHMGVAAALALRQCCQALRLEVSRLLCNEGWRQRSLCFTVQWIVRGPWLSNHLRERDHFDLPEGPSACDHASLAWPQHAVLANAQQLFVAQRFSSDHGGSDNVRLHFLPLGASGAVVPDASVRFDYWLSKLPQQRCLKATYPIKLAISDSHVFVMNSLSVHRPDLEVQVRLMDSGEVVGKFRVGSETKEPHSRAIVAMWQCSDDLPFLFGDMALSSAGPGIEMYVLHHEFDGNLQAMISRVTVFKADGRQCRPQWWVQLPESWRTSPCSDGDVHRLRASTIAVHSGLVYLAFSRPSDVSLISVYSLDGLPLRAWSVADSFVRTIPSSHRLAIYSIAVDDAAVYILAAHGPSAQQAAPHWCTAVLACSHHGHGLASIRLHPGPLCPGAIGSCFFGKLSVTDGCVCATHQLSSTASNGIAHTVHCLRLTA